MLKFEQGELKEAVKLFEVGTLEVPKSAAQDLRYWDSLPLKTKEDFVKAYEKLEDENHHDGCAYIIAKFAKDKKVMQIVLYIAAIHNVYGSLPFELGDLRYNLTNHLYNKIVGRK